MSEITNEQSLPIKDKSENKHSIRQKVWQELVNKKQYIYPLPFGRIPNFKGAKEASEKLLELTEFKSAKSVEVNPDKPLIPCRMLVLEKGKDLYVPIPQLRSSLLKKLETSDKYSIQKTVSRWGIDNLGKEISLEDEIHIDLLIVGSVAVSKEGYRIGKGRGYADFEFALLKEMNAIDDNTVIITLVHDIQVFDTLPSDIFEIYDVPVDIIITPTQILRVEQKLQRPEGIYWNLLSPQKLQAIEILQQLKDKHESEGREVILGVLQESDTRKSRPFFKNRRFTRSWKRNPQSSSSHDADKIPNGEHEVTENRIRNRENSSDENKGIHTRNAERTPRGNKFQDRDKRYSNRGRRFFRSTRETPQRDNENNENIPPRVKNYKRNPDGYSLCVSNIERTVRVSHLKNALTERGIRPNFIVWKGFRGFCYLHYTTKNKNSENNESFAIDNIIEKIQSIKINPTEEQVLDVKVMDPITRIETVNVTSV